MAHAAPTFRSHVTLALTTVLHAFTHIYGAMLLPLYLLIVADLHLGGVKDASFIVTVYTLVWCLGSYVAGVLADRFDRRMLLGMGLIGNALAIGCMGLTHNYHFIVAMAVAGGAFGALFHPTANALVPAHYPKSPGMAIGLLGMGAGLGFFFGPQYAGWRAQHAGWQLWQMSDWQRPCVELGIAGVIVGIIYLLVAREVQWRPKRSLAEVKIIHPPLGPVLRRRMIRVALVLGGRDFAGISMLTLTSIYLQKAHGLSVQRTGLIIGLMMLIGVGINPLSVWLSGGKRRLPSLRLALILGGIVLASIPFIPSRWVLLILLAFEACQLGSYAMSDAAILERVPAEKRGRVVGIFLTIAGGMASCGPWIMGFWTDAMKARADDPMAYLPLFATLGAAMALAALSTPLIAGLGEADLSAVNPAIEIMPATMERAGE